MPPSDPKFQLLASVDVLRDLPRRRLRQLAALVDEVTIDAGEVLIRQGQLNRHAYFVQSGSMGIDVDGERVATVVAGSIVGERTAIQHGLANATVTSLERSLVFAVDHRVLLGTASRDADFARLLRDLADDRTNRAA